MLRDSIRCMIAHFIDLLTYLFHFLIDLFCRMISLMPSMDAWLSVYIMQEESYSTVHSAVKIAASSALVDEGHPDRLQQKVLFSRSSSTLIHPSPMTLSSLSEPS